MSAMIFIERFDVWRHMMSSNGSINGLIVDRNGVVSIKTEGIEPKDEDNRRSFVVTRTVSSAPLTNQSANSHSNSMIISGQKSNPRQRIDSSMSSTASTTINNLNQTKTEVNRKSHSNSKMVFDLNFEAIFKLIIDLIQICRKCSILSVV